MSTITLNIDQVTCAAKLLAKAEQIPVSKATKYVNQFSPRAFPYVYRVLGGDKEEMHKWFRQQRQLKETEWDIRPKIQSRIAVRQQRAKIITALSA